MIKNKKIFNANWWNYSISKLFHSSNRQLKTKKIIATFVAIFISCILSLVFACSICNAWPYFGKIVSEIITCGFTKNYVDDMLSNIAIFIISGLSFIFAYKAGLFNIGISGQMVMAGTIGTIICHLCGLPSVLNQIVVMLLCIIFGALAAIVVGAMKVFLNVNEVVSSVMLNWIIYFMSILLLSSLPIPKTDAGDYTAIPDNSLLFKSPLANGQYYAFIPLLIIAFILIIASSIVLNKTVLGKKQKAIGINKLAGFSSGYNIKLNIIGAMAISGGLAGILGAVMYCGYYPQMPITSALKAIPTEGFIGIYVGLISMCSPYATFFVSFVLSMLQTSASNLQTYGIDNHIAQVIYGVVIYSITAIALLIAFKPYWWILEKIKGKQYVEKRQQKNLYHINLLEISINNQQQLKKQYFYYKKSLNVQSTLQIKFWSKVRIFISDIRYHFVYLHSQINKIINMRTCVNSKKKYFKQEMIHIYVHKNKLVIDKKQKKFFGWWIKINDNSFMFDKAIKMIEHLSNRKVDNQFIKQLNNQNNIIKKQHFNPNEILLIPKLSYLQSLRSGLVERYDIAHQNHLDYNSLLHYNKWANTICLPTIKNKHVFVAIDLIFISAWRKTDIEIKDIYKLGEFNDLFSKQIEEKYILNLRNGIKQYSKLNSSDKGGK